MAIKFLRVHQAGISKHKALECLQKEITILALCDHPHIAKIIEASFDGVLVKEPLINHSPTLSSNES